jgi:hypothetical protein
MDTRVNPLQQYFRQFKLFLKLPSGTTYYSPDVVEFTDMGEIGVMAMTGKDELILKNPDALLNGEALIEVFQSCIPAVKKPRALLKPDIDALITAIRFATYNDSLEMSQTCPNCHAENTYKLDLQYALDNMSYLDETYVVNLPNGLSIFVRPYTFPDMLGALHTQFETTKIARSIENSGMDDKKRAEMFNSAFKEIAITKFKLMTSNIVRIVDESKGINVTDKSFINEFLRNTDREIVNQIDKLVDEINEIGIKKTFKAVFTKCSHEWDSDVDFNPVNFL